MALNINDPSGDLFAELVRLVEELTLLESTLEPATPFDRASSRAQRKLVRPTFSRMESWLWCGAASNTCMLDASSVLTPS